MRLQIEGRRNVTICAGCGNTGKSTFALRYLVNAKLAARFVFDPEGEYAQRLGLASAGDGYALGLALLRGWIIFDPHPMFTGRMEEAFSFFCDWSFEMASRLPGPKVLVVDEVWKYCSPQAIPQHLANVCQTGRKRGLALMVNTQLPHKLNGSILNEVSEFVAFRLQFTRALDLVSEYGFEPAQVSALPDLAFIARTDKGGELRGAIKV